MRRIYGSAAVLLAALTLLLCNTTMWAQNKMRQPNKENSQEKKYYPPGSAWTLATELGIHEPNTIDTLMYNYQHKFVPAMTYDAYATTGQLTGPGLSMIYFDRPERRQFFFNNAVQQWIPSFSTTKFYNVFIPMTLLSYNFSTGREIHSDLVKAEFAGNVNRRIGIGANMTYPYTKGSYAEQAAKGINFGLSFYYTGDHYQTQAFYNQYRHLNKENGGITDDLYITDPAAVQGGVNDIDSKSIPVRLSDVHNLLNGQEFYMSHAYCLGFYRDITQPEDTVERKELVPVTKFIYSLDFNRNKRRFMSRDAASASEFWQDTYFNSSESDELDSHMSLRNTFGIQMVEGFQKWFPFGLSVWATYDYDRYWYNLKMPQSDDSGNPGEDTDNLTPLPEGFDINPSAKRSRLWVSGRLEKQKGKIIRYYADAKFGLLGDAIGDIDVNGKFTTRFRLGKDTVEIAAEGFFKNLEPDWTLKHYVGNHFVWNNNFGKIRSFRVGGHLYIPWTKTDISVNFENVQNMVYFNSSCLPEQYGGSIQVFSARLDQHLSFGIWNWNNRITYQTSSDKSRLPLPVLSVYSNMFLQFRIATLKLQLGIDCDYYTKYQGMLYQPATMAFHVQGENAKWVGNYPLCNVYLNCKLYKTRFFVMCSHVNQNWFGRNYFSMPGYPVNPRQLRLGVSVDFAN